MQPSDSCQLFCSWHGAWRGVPTHLPLPHLPPQVLYCAKKAGVTHILKAGGAQVRESSRQVMHLVMQQKTEAAGGPW